jgi:competence protein CoiA
MKFALVDGVKSEALKGFKGFCQGCGSELIAKCGVHKINHWAHKNNRICDSWWEPETEWHRSWKNNFPVEWQEFIQIDNQTKEKHIADVRTEYGLVIEFQHSYITQQERNLREKFYKNMVWVVDGTRLKRDYPRFLKEWKSDGISNVYKTDKSGIFKVSFPEFCFPEAWLKSSVPVIFDFRGDGTIEDPEEMRNTLYCLFPQVGGNARVAEISRKAFLNSTIKGEWTLRVQEFINDFRTQDEIARKEHNQTTSHSSNKVTYSWRGIPLIGGNKEYKKRISASHKSNRKRR